MKIIEKPKLHIFDLPNKNPWLNLAFENYFLTAMEKNPKDFYLIFYQNFPSIILGKTLQKEKEIFKHKKHPPVLFRLSGGGSVLHGDGNLNYAFAANLEEHPQLFSVPFSYQKILQGIIDELNQSFINYNRSKFCLQGHSDICIFQKNSLRKISGNSQVRKKNWLLHHGTFLYQKDILKKISYYLKFPPKIPEYRKQRSHQDFLIQTLPIRHSSQIKKIIIRSFEKNFSCEAKQNFKIPKKSVLWNYAKYTHLEKNL